MGLSDDEIMTTFQSRFGREEWLKPYTSETLKELPKQGIKNIHIISHLDLVVIVLKHLKNLRKKIKNILWSQVVRVTIIYLV